MKTVINESGCTTHPYGEPSLDVTVPLTVNGHDVTEKLTQLTVANLKLSMKVEELETSLELLQKLLKTTQEALETRLTALSQVIGVASVSKTEEPIIAATPKNGKKTTTKPTTESSTETITTTV